MVKYKYNYNDVNLLSLNEKLYALEWYNILHNCHDIKSVYKKMQITYEYIFNETIDKKKDSYL